MSRRALPRPKEGLEWELTKDPQSQEGLTTAPTSEYLKAFPGFAASAHVYASLESTHLCKNEGNNGL
jgi:hypothetical protein